MVTFPYPLRSLALALCLALAWTGPARSDPDLQRQALALNDITGDDPIEAKIEALVKDEAGTKKLLAEAAKMLIPPSGSTASVPTSR
jgi:hypothetical protein